MRFISTILFGSVITAFGVDIASAETILSTPHGLQAGGHFRFVYVTRVPTTVYSSDIATYDAFVNYFSDATYNGERITWKAIASTSSVNAINHIGVTGYPVYNVDGVRVAATDSTGPHGLWSGSLESSISQYIGSKPTGNDTYVWTGTNTDGTATAYGGTTPGTDSPTGTLGSSRATVGDRFSSDYKWSTYWYPETIYTHYKMYGISEELTVMAPDPSTVVPDPSTVVPDPSTVVPDPSTVVPDPSTVVPEPSTVVPEPSTAIMTGIGCLFALACCVKRKRSSHSQ